MSFIFYLISLLYGIYINGHNMLCNACQQNLVFCFPFMAQGKAGRGQFPVSDQHPLVLRKVVSASPAVEQFEAWGQPYVPEFQL